MFQFSPGLTGFMLAVMPLVVSGDHAVPDVPRRRAIGESGLRLPAINAYLQEHVDGSPSLQLFNREQRSRQEFERSIAITCRRSRTRSLRMAGFIRSSSSWGCWHWVCFSAYGGFRIRRGALTLGVLVAFFQYGLRFFRPIQDLSEKYNILQGAMAASERIFKLLDTPCQVVSPTDVDARDGWAERYRVRSCLVCLPRRGLGVAGCQLSCCGRAKRSPLWAIRAQAKRPSPISASLL